MPRRGAKKSSKRSVGARKGGARKTGARKAGARKRTAARKSSARKTGARKAGARKRTAARKSSARKTGARKTAARKRTGARKVSTRVAVRKTAARGGRKIVARTGPVPQRSQSPGAGPMGVPEHDREDLNGGLSEEFFAGVEERDTVDTGGDDDLDG